MSYLSEKEEQWLNRVLQNQNPNGAIALTSEVVGLSAEQMTQLQQVVADKGSPQQIYRFAAENHGHPGCDIDALQKALVGHQDIYQPGQTSAIGLFAQDVPGADIPMLQNAVVASGRPEHMVNFAEVPGCDAVALAERVIESGNKQSMKNFLERVQDEKACQLIDAEAMNRPDSPTRTAANKVLIEAAESQHAMFASLADAPLQNRITGKVVETPAKAIASLLMTGDALMVALKQSQIGTMLGSITDKLKTSMQALAARAITQDTGLAPVTHDDAAKLVAAAPGEHLSEKMLALAGGDSSMATDSLRQLNDTLTTLTKLGCEDIKGVVYEGLIGADSKEGMCWALSSASEYAAEQYMNGNLKSGKASAVLENAVRGLNGEPEIGVAKHLEQVRENYHQQQLEQERRASPSPR